MFHLVVVVCLVHACSYSVSHQLYPTEDACIESFTPVPRDFSPKLQQYGVRTINGTCVNVKDIEKFIGDMDGRDT